MDPALQEMIDEHALRKLVHAYCRAVDRGDVAALRELYHPDAVDAHGAFSTGSVEGFFEQLVASRPYIRAMAHNITTVNFAIDGSTAEGEIYNIAVHTLVGKGRDIDLIIGGRYLDKYEKRDSVWKLLERTIVTDWARVTDPSTMDTSHPITADTLKGTLDESDPSFQFFALLNAGSGPRDGAAWRSGVHSDRQ